MKNDFFRGKSNRLSVKMVAGCGSSCSIWQPTTRNQKTGNPINLFLILFNFLVDPHKIHLISNREIRKIRISTIGANSEVEK